MFRPAVDRVELLGSRALVEPVRAFEAADVPALVRLLTDEAVLAIPPVPLWYQGSRDYGRFMDRVFAMHGPGWAARPVTANGQVFTVTGGRVACNVVFADLRVFEAFDLPQQLPQEGNRS